MYLTVQSVFRPTTANILTRISTLSTGAEGDADSFSAQFSPDGRYVAFDSDASNLVTGDTNDASDVFLKDLVTGAITRISTASDGAQADEFSGYVQFSPNGRYVLFESKASNLVAGDTNGTYDVFLKDLVTGAVTRISTAADGMTEGNADSGYASFSPDGRHVLFRSDASNLVAGDNNGTSDVFLKNLSTGAITRISMAADGTTQGNGSSYTSGTTGQFSPDGRYVLFESRASNLVPGDTNFANDVFLKDLITGAVTRISSAADGTPGNSFSQGAQFSPNGRYVLFESNASNLVANDTNNLTDIFLKDLVTGAVSRISSAADGTPANADSLYARFSPDGRYVIFESSASNLVAGDTNDRSDIFLKDLATGAITLLSAASDGAPANEGSNYAQFSRDGRYVVFDSDASNLVAGDTNDSTDLFLVNLAYKANTAAIAGGRYIETTLGVGTASKASIAWGDGTSSTVTPAGGKAAFSHAYASTGIKAATVILTEGALTWKVAHTVNLGAGTLVRNTAIADTLSGGSGKDSLTGDSYANILLGGSNNDRLSAGAGNDRLDAGSGNDSLYGSSGNDTLDSSSGNDRLDAGSGNDRLSGGSGQDTLIGGSGRDAFVFDDRQTSSSKSTADYIADFSGRSGDKIDLRAIDANTKKGGDQNFSFIGKKDFSKAGEVRYEKTKGYTYVYLNTDSDKSAEAVIKLKGSFEMSKGWFVL